MGPHIGESFGIDLDAPVLAGLEDPCIPSPYTIENDSNFVVKFLSRYLEIHELPNGSPLITQLCSEPGEMAFQLLQHVVDRCPGCFDGTLLLGELLQGGRNTYDYGHVSSPSSGVAGCVSVRSRRLAS